VQPIKSYQIHKVHLVEQSLDKAQRHVVEDSMLVEDSVVVEEPLEIWISHRINKNSDYSTQLLFITMRTPGDDLNLVKGWLFSSGAVQNPTKIASITHTGSGRLKNQSTNRVLVTLAADIYMDISQYQRLEVMNSSCGVCGQQSIDGVLDKINQRQSVNDTNIRKMTLPVRGIYQLTEELRTQQTLFGQSGGNHGVALFDNDLNVIDVREDVGRHNALDKLIGANLNVLLVGGPTNLNKHSATSFGLVLSGRVSFELVQKAAMANISCIVAIGAPTSLAIDLAKDCDICLVGFVKQDKFNVYSCAGVLF
jgi:FdhD protein